MMRDVLLPAFLRLDSGRGGDVRGGGGLWRLTHGGNCLQSKHCSALVLRLCTSVFFFCTALVVASVTTSGGVHTLYTRLHPAAFG